MNVVYSSHHYHVVEFPGLGFEVIKKPSAMGTYLQGDTANRFRQHFAELVAEQASVELVDDYLGNFDALMNQPAVYH